MGIENTIRDLIKQQGKERRLGDKRIEQIYNSLFGAKMRAYLSADQLNIVDTTWTPVEIDTEDYDVGGNFNTGTYTFIAPVAGYFHISGQVIWLGASVVADRQYWTGISVNDVIVAAIPAQAAYVGPVGASISTDLLLAVDDEVKLEAYCNTGVGTVDIDGGAAWQTFLAIHLLSK